MAPLFSLSMSIFDKLSKKATNTAVEMAKETLNDKLETYSGIIKIWLTLGVMVFGAKQINAHISKPNPQQLPMQGTYPQQPIVINNYFDRGYIPNGKQGKTGQGHQNRR